MRALYAMNRHRPSLLIPRFEMTPPAGERGRSCDVQREQGERIAITN